MRKVRDCVAQEYIELYNTELLTCNIHDYVKWGEDVGIFSKKKAGKILKYADLFIAYSAYLNAFELQDSLRLRKKWYNDCKGKIILKGLNESGWY